MSIIKLSNINKSYGDINTLTNITFDINEGEKVGIIGNNGTGKTTLINIISGNEIADSGNVWLAKGTKIGYLKQTTDYTLDNLSKGVDITNFLKMSSYLNIRTNNQNLSGGEKTKIALAHILAQKPTLLLLDEPTNHVDTKASEWIINQINNYEGTVLIVSHDRYFLNQTVQKIIEINHHKAKIYNGNYDSYQIQKTKDLNKAKATYIKEQKQDKKILKEISLLKNWSEKGEKEAGKQGGSVKDARSKGIKDYHQQKAVKLAKNAKNKRTRLEKMRKNYIENPPIDKPVKFNFNGYCTNNNLIIQTNRLAKSFDNNLIFSDANIIVKGGEKIGLIGPNGSGKTTFIKLLLNKEQPSSGSIWKSASLKIAYMSQDVFNLNENTSILKLGHNYDKQTKELFFSNLVNMGIKRSIFNNKISTLSLGQRMKIKLAQIIIDNYNLLILDEPTNHLDLECKIELEKALVNFKGTIIIASHDRYLLSKVTNKVFIFENNKIQRLENGYKDYIN